MKPDPTALIMPPRPLIAAVARATAQLMDAQADLLGCPAWRPLRRMRLELRESDARNELTAARLELNMWRLGR